MSAGAAVDELAALTHVFACPSMDNPDALQRALAAIDSIGPASTICDPVTALVAQQFRLEAEASASYTRPTKMRLIAASLKQTS
jgi:hypothetical protein